MAVHRLRRGLDLPISGAPVQRLEDARAVSSVAVVAVDYPGMKPTMLVGSGEAVQLGQALFEDKKEPGVVHTAPGTGTVTGVHRGAKRALESVVIRLDGGDSGQGKRFEAYTGRHPSSLDRDQVKGLLLESGLWTALRSRPYGRVPSPEATPHSIFVTAVDSNPLAPNLELIADGRESDVERGLHALAKLTDGPVFVCLPTRSKIQVPQGRFRAEAFAGPHPAGTVGIHIHTLDPVDRSKQVWYLGLQDAIAIGSLFETGSLDTSRAVSLCGPSVTNPRLLRTRIGAAIDDLVEGELRATPPRAIGSGTDDAATSSAPNPHRVLSGSVLSGREASGPITGYLGRYHQQISVVPEDRERRFLGWMVPGVSLFSTTRLFVSKLVPGKRFGLTTTTHGSERAIIPIGLYERVMPVDLQPTFLLKSLVMGDVARAEELGCLELEEEDLALCTFVCPGKTDYGPYLRDALTVLEKEG